MGISRMYMEEKKFNYRSGCNNHNLYYWYNKNSSINKFKQGKRATNRHTLVVQP